MDKTVEKEGISTMMKEVNEDSEFQIVHVMFMYIVHPIANKILQQVCALKVLAISIGKGHNSLFYVHEEYKSVGW